MKWYGLIGMNHDAFIKALDEGIENGACYDYEYVLQTPHKEEIAEYLKNKLLNGYCVEIYEGDEDGELIAGSDFDDAEHFCKSDIKEVEL